MMDRGTGPGDPEPRDIGHDIFQAMFEASPHGVFVSDRDGRYLLVNEAGRRITGYSHQELLSRGIRDMIPEDAAQLAAEHFERVVDTGRSSGELPFLRRDGTRGWVSVEAVRISPDRMLGFVTDVTARHALREKLELNENRLARAQDIAKVGWFEFDLAAGTVRASSQARTIYGLDTDREFTVAEAQQIPLPEYRSNLDQALADLIRHGRPYDVTFRVHRVSDGKEATIHSVAEYDRDRNVVFGMIQDISEVRELEDMLRQAQKMEAVGRLAGGVAHDFNNLLTPIIGFAEMLRDGLDEDDERFSDVVTILRAAERARDLTAQLLAFGRKQLLDMQVIDVNAVIVESEPMLRRLLRENVRLDLNLSAALGAVQADVSQLNTVMINLAVNAADAMPDGGVLRIETHDVELDDEYAQAHPGSRPGRHVMVAVSDDGAGMDVETLAMIFEPFFTTKGADQGTGLGLATVHGIVKQHGGSIWVYSEPGRGTTFKVYLPMVAAEPAAVEIAAVPIQLRGDERILLVEDDESVRALTEVVLQRYGYEVVAMGSPAGAVELLTGDVKPFDLLLTDVVMPGMNGVQLHRTLQGVWPDLPAIFMSGYTDNVVAHHGILSQGLHFIQKPFMPTDLVRCVREVLD